MQRQPPTATQRPQRQEEEATKGFFDGEQESAALSPFPFEGRLLLIGLGTIGLGVIPLLLKHLSFTLGVANAISVITGDDRLSQAKVIQARFGIPHQVVVLTKDNYLSVLECYDLQEGDLLLNLSVDVSSLSLLEFCHDRGILYLDTVVEPWEGYYYDPTLSTSERSNYALRHEAMLLKARYGSSAPTAVITMGANPGLVSCFVKQALLQLDAESVAEGQGSEERKAEIEANAGGESFTQRDWATLAHRLGVQTIHIAERDTQYALEKKKKGEFTNTWSVDGFLSEGNQPAELGWGTHEPRLPHDARTHSFGANEAIYLNSPGAAVCVRSWTPMEGPYHGFLITHNESISIAAYLSLTDTDLDTGEQNLLYRPTVNYAYHPCDDAVLSLHELRGKNFAAPASKKVLMEEIVGGVDELGVLVMGRRPGSGQTFALWYGSQLSAVDAKARAEFNSATSLQVTSTIVAGVIWALQNPQKGIVEPDEIPHRAVLDFVEPLIKPVVGVHTTWTPLESRTGPAQLFADESIDASEPFAFCNVRV